MNRIRYLAETPSVRPEQAQRNKSSRLKDDERALLAAFRQLMPAEREKLIRLAEAKGALSTWGGLTDERGRKGIGALNGFGLSAVSRETYRKLRRLIFNRLPTVLPVRRRVRLARDAAHIGRETVHRAIWGSNERTETDARRERIRIVNTAAVVLQTSMEDIDDVSGIIEDDLSCVPGGFLGIVDELARGKGLTSGNGRLVGAKVIGALRTVARLLRELYAEPAPAPSPIRQKVMDAASHFDLAVARQLEGNLKRKPLARLISDLRIGADLPPATPGAIEQRLRDRGIG